MIATLLCLAFVIAASVTDIRSRRIYNTTTYPGIVTAIVWNAVGTLGSYYLHGSLGASELPQPELYGWVGIGDCLAGFAACGLLMLVCFVFFGVGGGDVKLLAMVGAFLGLYQGIEALLWTFILGACLGLLVLIWRVGFVTLLGRALRHLRSLVWFGTAAGLTPQERAELKTELFLAPCAAVGVVIVKFSWWQIW